MLAAALGIDCPRATEDRNVVAVRCAWCEINFRRSAVEQFGQLFAGVFDSRMGEMTWLVYGRRIAEPAFQKRQHRRFRFVSDAGGCAVVEVDHGFIVAAGGSPL